MVAQREKSRNIFYYYLAGGFTGVGTPSKPAFYPIASGAPRDLRQGAGDPMVLTWVAETVKGGMHSGCYYLYVVVCMMDVCVYLFGNAFT